MRASACSQNIVLEQHSSQDVVGENASLKLGKTKKGPVSPQLGTQCTEIQGASQTLRQQSSSLVESSLFALEQAGPGQRSPGETAQPTAAAFA